MINVTVIQTSRQSDIYTTRRRNFWDTFTEPPNDKAGKTTRTDGLSRHI